MKTGMMLRQIHINHEIYRLIIHIFYLVYLYILSSTTIESF